VAQETSDPTLLTELEHGPASSQTRSLERTLRRTWLPLARSWRMTPRGIRMLQRITDPTGHPPVLRGTRVDPTRVAGVPGEWVRAQRAIAQTPPGAAAAGQPAPGAPLLVYLHGGGYVFGSPRTHRNLVSRLSHVTGLPALSVDYRLPPVATLPAPVEDALAVYRALLDAGHAPDRIVVAGDSAGGNLALALALHAAEAGLPLPAALALLSPWADLTMSLGSHVRNDRLDPFIPAQALQRAARLVAGGADPAGWRISPLFAPDELWRRLPPTLVQVGSTEVLLDDGTAVARRVAESGTRAELHVFDRQPHVVPLWAGTPEARTALRAIGRFTSSLLAPESAPPAPSAADAQEAAAGPSAPEPA
jgi:epsilon-lactone hydrolase